MIMQLHQWSGTIFAIFNQLRGTKHWGIKVTQPKVASLKDHSFTHVCSNSVQLHQYSEKADQVLRCFLRILKESIRHLIARLRKTKFVK